MQIERVEVMVVAPKVQRFTWSHDLGEQYMTNTIVRITTKDGHEGVGGVSNYTSYDYDRYTCETLRHLIPGLVGRDTAAREEIWQSLWPRVFPLPPQALSVIDIALWDLRGKAAGLPIHQLLGGAMDRIPSYASTPLLDDVPAYLRFVEEMIEIGFRAVKFHCWCLPEKDLELARAASKEFGGDVAFMLDVENNYDLRSARRVGAESCMTWGSPGSRLRCWTTTLPGYRELTRSVEVPIIPSGNWIQDLTAFQHALATRCWSAARTDVTVAGGFTGGRRVSVCGGSGGHAMRDHVLGQHAGLRRQPPSDAGDRAEHVLRASGALGTLRIRHARRDPDRAGRTCRRAFGAWTGRGNRLEGHGSGDDSPARFPVIVVAQGNSWGGGIGKYCLLIVKMATFFTINR